MNEPIAAVDARFIKLGSGGEWEQECIRDGVLRLDYRDVPYELCSKGKWEDVKSGILSRNSDKGAASRHLNQIRDFYTAPASWLWITFSGDSMYWCFAEEPVTCLTDGTTIRKAVNGWKSTDIYGKPLSKTRLSGNLLAVQGYRGTICSVAKDYVVRKINGSSPIHVETAVTALESLEQSLIPVITGLSWRDFELFVDLLFRNSGWNRLGDVGKTEKDIDLALESPVTGERIAAQIKSRAAISDLEDYRQRFSSMTGFDRFYFVTHQPVPAAEDRDWSGDNTFHYWGPRTLARLSVRGSLVQWLLDKAG